MGTKQSTVAKSEGGLFNWKRIPVPADDNIDFDPRYDAVKFGEKKLLITDCDQRVFEWEIFNDDESDDKKDEEEAAEQKGLEQRIQYKLSTVHKYDDEQNATILRPQKIFDAAGSSLVWIHENKHVYNHHTFYYYDIASKQLHSFEISQWIVDKYGAENAKKIQIRKRCLINRGNGMVIFLIIRNTAINQVDIIQLDIVQKTEVKSVAIAACDELKQLNNSSHTMIDWGFMQNPNGNEVSLILENKSLNLTSILFVSLADGSILWNAQFDVVYDIGFNSNGKYFCIFERPKKTGYGYIHILNVTRLQWICQIRLTYHGFGLGWDAFRFIENNNLVFIAPNELQISSPTDLEWRIQAIHDKEDGGGKEAEQENQSKQESEKKKVKKVPVDKLHDLNAKKICVLSLDQRWWDVEVEVMARLKELFSDENVCQLILEYGGLNWAIVQFDYPSIAETNKTKELKSHLAMCELFATGTYEDCNILLLTRNIRDTQQMNVNKWVFDVCIIPKVFEIMWNMKGVQKTVIKESE